VAADAPRTYSDHIETPPAKERIMNVLKHMEAVFVLALAVAASAGYVAAARESQPQPQLASNIATPTKMAIVTISAKRPTAAQKRQLLLAERAERSRA
jgi:methylthioribose-1-phosphate isomerase